MPIVGSGSLYLRGQEDNKSIAFEMYENVTGSNISLHELSELASLTGSPELGQGMSEFYGFQNQAPPETVTTSGVSSVSSTTAVFNGSVTVASGGVTARGFKYMSGNQSVATLIASGTERVAGSGVGSFSYTQTGLAVGTAYSYVAWAENEAGRTYAGARTYFGTLQRYTYTFTNNASNYYPSYPSCLCACLKGTKSATVDQGQTATVHFTLPSCIAYCWGNAACVCNNYICGQYNAAGACAAGGIYFGTYYQKASMNSNASGCYCYSNGPSPNDCQQYNELCVNSQMEPYLSKRMCYRTCVWQNTGNSDPADAINIWFERNQSSFSWEAWNANGVGTVQSSSWQIQRTGQPGSYRQGELVNCINTGQSVIGGVTDRHGSSRFPSQGFQYRYDDIGPWTNTCS